MCVIAYKKPGAKLPDEIINKCWARNAQGGGYVFIPFDKRKPVVSEKGIMDLPQFKEKTAAFRHEAGSLIIHFRIQSRGGVSADLTHPFDFSKGDEKRYLFHNGTARLLNTSYNQSDSLALANMLKVLDDEDCLAILEKLVKEGFGRFVAVIGRNIYTYGDNESEVKDKVWFSNLKHETFDGKKITVGDGADYGDWDGHGYGHREVYPRQLPAPRPTTDDPNRIELSADERIDIMTLAATKVANIRNIPLERIDGYVDQIISDFKLRSFSSQDLYKLKALIDTNTNPLFEFFRQSFQS